MVLPVVPLWCVKFIPDMGCLEFWIVDPVVPNSCCFCLPVNCVVAYKMSKYKVQQYEMFYQVII